MLRVAAMYFSPTGTTRRVVSHVAEGISEKAGGAAEPAHLDFTLPGARSRGTSFQKGEVVVFGIPVYAGRVPRVLLEYLKTIRGNGALGVAMVVYGNRDYDDALVELSDLLETQGFLVVAAAAFIGEHSYSKVLARGRPDADDLALATAFAARVTRKISGSAAMERAVPKGNRPYRQLPVPRNERGELIDLSSAKPETSSSCQECKKCVEVCPLGCIDQDDVTKIDGDCIRCNACVKACPSEAKSFSHGDYLIVKHWLETHCTQRRAPEFFL